MILLGLVFAIGIFSWWMTGCLCQRNSKLFLLDHPNARSLHEVPTPRSGGVAILASVAMGLGITAIGFAAVPPASGFLAKGVASDSIWIVGSIALVAITSFLDDRRGLPIGLRLAVQAIASVVVVWGVGLTLSSIPIPGIRTIELGCLAAPVSVLFLLWMTNLYNFMDGMDGLAGGMTVLGFGCLAFLGWTSGHLFMLFTTAIVSMSALGFLIHNFPPARIFMGDVGSIPLGFTSGTLMLLGLREGLFDLWVPILIFAPFILDATVTVLSRAWQGKPLWQAHREHLYQRLVLSGWGHRKTVLAEYSVMVVCGGLAVLYQSATEEWRLVILGIWGMLFLSLALLVRNVEKRLHACRS